MSAMTRLLSIVAATLVAVPPVLPASPEPTELRLVSTVWPPFTDRDDRPRFAVELVYEALDRIGVRRSTALVEDGALTASLRAGSYDGSAALWYSDERASFLLYSEPYLENRLVLVGRKGSDVSAARVADLAGRRIALVRDYAYGDEIEGVDGPILVRGPSLEANLGKLLRGEVDYVLMDELVVRYIAEHHRAEAAQHLELGSTPLVRRSLHLALRKDIPEAASILARFDETIRAMIADGTYNRILQLNWIRADVDGDGRPELVLRGDRAGAAPPAGGYDVLAVEAAKAPGEGAAPGKARPSRFVIGGEIYEGWDDVPERYKVGSLQDPDPDRSTARAFTFRF